MSSPSRRYRLLNSIVSFVCICIYAKPMNNAQQLATLRRGSPPRSRCKNKNTFSMFLKNRLAKSMEIVPRRRPPSPHRITVYNGDVVKDIAPTHKKQTKQVLRSRHAGRNAHLQRNLMRAKPRTGGEVAGGVR